jgi:beta-glucosidase
MTLESTSDAMRDAYARADALLARMTLREKIGQMTQVEPHSITPDEVRRHAIGSVLSGGGGNPEPNTPETWRAMVTAFEAASRQSRLGVPMIYGVDAVHGHNNVVGATIFPHNIGLGAAGDEDLVRRIGRATALEVAATGVRWDFAPAVSIPLDVRWGRTYEGYAQDAALASRLAAAFVAGLRGDDWNRPDAVLPSVKHFVADGATRFGTSTRLDRIRVEQDRTLANAGVDEGMRRLIDAGAWTIDQGAAEGDDAWLREVALPPYRACLEAGALNVMASYSSWNGVRMHAHRELLTELLKGELGFGGFVVSDWEGIELIDPDYDAAVEASVNAGVDMSMVPFDYLRFMDALERLVGEGRVSEARIDDAARRILAVKARLGLLDALADGADDGIAVAAPPALEVLGCPEHRALAREAAAASQVLLKNDGELLPLPASGRSLLVAGAAADDVGLACGGWTISWMGSAGPITPGSTVLAGIRELAPDAPLRYERDAGGQDRADVGVVVVHEEPYAEGMGDRRSVALDPAHQALVRRVRERVEALVLIVISGRPLVLGPAAEAADAIIAAWLPGAEAAGVADPLFGRVPYRAKLRYLWPADDAQLPLHPFGGAVASPAAGEPAWTIGDGLDSAVPLEGT